MEMLSLKKYIGWTSSSSRNSCRFSEIHSKFGTLPWEDLVKPAIDLATNGYIVTEKQERSLRK